jgi:hypothetical protein
MDGSRGLRLCPTASHALLLFSGRALFSRRLREVFYGRKRVHNQQLSANRRNFDQPFERQIVLSSCLSVLQQNVMELGRAPLGCGDDLLESLRLLQLFGHSCVPYRQSSNARCAVLPTPFERRQPTSSSYEHAPLVMLVSGRSSCKPEMRGHGNRASKCYGNSNLQA